MSRFLPPPRRRGLLLAALLVLAVGALGSSGGARYFAHLLALAAAMATATLGLALVHGRAGQVCLGQGASMAAGAYTWAALAPHSLPLALAAAAAAGALAGAAMALPARRLSGLPLALASMACAVIAEVLAMRTVAFTGGTAGRFVAPPTLSTFDEAATALTFATLCLGLAVLLLYRLDRATLGRAWRALAQAPEAALALGLDVGSLRRLAFVAAGLCGGLGGAAYAQTLGFISPEQFGLPLSFELLVIAFLGGLRRPAGIVLASLTFVALPEFADRLRPLVGELGGWNPLVLGLAVVFVTVFRKM
ncbi:MAG: branched-chain amino acid ABC transporter permease [Tepidiphilus sp.]|nr:branched-chain amino acid ABC transporter permease [Tepidiphilus sp.]